MKKKRDRKDSGNVGESENSWGRKNHFIALEGNHTFLKKVPRFCLFVLLTRAV
jgi:hypothetical protein